MLNHLKPINAILCADGYKGGHWEELPLDILYNYAVCVPRKVSPYSKKIVAMGMAMAASFFASVRITREMIDEAELEITQQGYRFNRAGWEYIVNEHGGKLPLEIFGVEEGRLVDPQTPILGIRNTDPKLAWLPTYYETFLQALVWKMSTVASVCRAVRISLIEFCEMTGTDPSCVNYMLHNFGDRSADSPHEAAIIAGIAHAALFDGSDCIRANGYIKALYGTTEPSTSSIEATEHSVMCAHSDAEHKDDWGAALMAVDRLYACVQRAKEGIGLPFMSVVIDTYDSRRFVRDYLGTRLKDRILASGGRLIARPDSGDPTIEPGLVAKDLEDTFGVTERTVKMMEYDEETGFPYQVAHKTYKVLHPAVGVIQGDGIRVGTFEGVVQGWIDAGYALDNFCLGMGSGVTHDGARDDFSFSFKSVATFRNGEWYRELKDPITDSGKKSLSGLVCCREDDNGNLVVVDAMNQPDSECMDVPIWSPTLGWQLYYAHGERVYRQEWNDVKKRARS